MFPSTTQMIYSRINLTSDDKSAFARTLSQIRSLPQVTVSR